MISRLATAAVAAIAIVAAGVGCGGSDSSDTSFAQSDGGTLTTSPLSKAAYIKQVDAACERERANMFKEYENYQHQFPKGVPEHVLIANVIKAVVLPTAETESAAIRKLGAPEGDEEEIEAILAARQTATDEVKKLKAMRHYEVLALHFKKVDQTEREYGFTACHQ